MPAYRRLFELSPSDASRILFSGAVTNYVTQHRLAQFVAECGTKNEALEVIHRLSAPEGDVLIKKFNQRMGAEDRIRCLSRLQRGKTRLRREIVTELVRGPIKYWFNKKIRKDYWSQGILSAKEIDLMVSFVLRAQNPEWALIMSELHVLGPRGEPPPLFLNKIQHERLKTLASKHGFKRTNVIPSDAANEP